MSFYSTWPTLKLWSEMAYTNLPPKAGIISTYPNPGSDRKGKGFWLPSEILLFFYNSTRSPIEIQHEPQMQAT